MYLDYWGLKKFPFENVPDPEFMYYAKGHEEALVRLLYIIKRNKGAALLTGEVGCGKTTLSRVIIKQLPEMDFDIALITNPSLDPIDFLKEVLHQFGMNSETSSKSDLINLLNSHLLENMKAQKISLLIVDEAQLIKPGTFEEVRLLLNFQLNDRFLLTFVLIGQPELQGIIRDYKQLDQRIAIRYHLNPLGFEETAEYIAFRLNKAGLAKNVFNGQAIEDIYQYSEGVPRKINNVCDIALLIGFSIKAAKIDADIILKVIDKSL
ncbi:MAG: AAA family ATPase [Syntrophales bacterium]|nr:AAA family ATPase [Syntrophales bacterium]